MEHAREYKSDVFCILMQYKKNALQVYNINPNKNQEMLSHCPVLSEYQFFVEKSASMVQLV